MIREGPPAAIPPVRLGELSLRLGDPRSGVGALHRRTYDPGMRVRTLVTLVTLLVVGAGLLVQLANSNDTDDQTYLGTPIPADAIVVEIHSSNTKQDWIDQVAASFNAGDHTVNGSPIAVTVEHVGSGSSIVAGYRRYRRR